MKLTPSADPPCSPPRVSCAGVVPGRTYLGHNEEGRSLPLDAIDVWDFVAVNDHKGSGVGPDILVLRKCDAHALDAIVNPALTHDLERVLVAKFDDAFIDLAEKDLVLCPPRLRHEPNLQRFRSPMVG